MLFQLLPILETMIQFYQQPLCFDRFQLYIKLLQGNTKGDLVLPIGGFNPMAKEHVLENLIGLKALDIEQVINKTLQEISNKNQNIQPIFKVAFNLSDDLKGAWTNRFTADYDNKFKFSALLKRNFCSPIFWTSETYSEQLIIERTQEFCYRTIYWLSHPNPRTLQDHILQEVFIAKEINAEVQAGIDFEPFNQFYQTYKTSTDYSTIFNFLYGDDAAVSLGNNPLGIKEAFAGFKFSKWLATNKK